MNKNKRRQWEIRRNRTSSRRRSIRERAEREDAAIKQGLLLILAQLITEKNNGKHL